MSNTTPPRLEILRLPDHWYENYKVTFKFKSTGYFQQNAVPPMAGHFAIVMRGDIDSWEVAVWGVGLIFGRTFNEQTVPSIRIETWFNGVPPGNYLLDGVPGAPELHDGVEYMVEFLSIVPTNRANQTIQFKISTEADGLLYDSGPVHDPNVLFDPAKNSIFCGHVFDNEASGPWEFAITDVKLFRG
jgi:hypothetical protein